MLMNKRISKASKLLESIIKIFGQTQDMKQGMLVA